METNFDIIVLGIQAWDIEIGSNCKNIAQEFSKKYRVMYVNPPLDRLSAFRNKNDEKIKKRLRIIKAGKPEIVKISDNLWNVYTSCMLESISSLKPDFLFDFLNKINNKRFANEIKRAAQDLKFGKFIVFNDSDMFRSFHMKELLKPEIYIYYTRDNLIAVDFWKTQGIRIEALHMKKADLVVANSTYLSAQAKKHNVHSYYVGQGCDVSLFDRNLIEKVPEDIVNIKPPVIGYIGALLALRLDINVLEHIAKERPAWSLVLVGPEDEAFKKSDLHSFINVYFLGNKTADLLPAYLSKFDVALNPQVLSPVTIGNYPRKIDEYLAMGKPTVATKTEAMSVFSEYTYLAGNKEEYITFIEKALSENSEELRRKRETFARLHTWENNVLEIVKAAQQVTNIKIS